MKRLSAARVLAGFAFLTCLACQPMMAQGQGGPGGPGGGGGRNFDPEQMRQRMMERYREEFGIKNDDEWKLVSERITKVNDARRAVGFGGGMRMMGRPPGGGPQGGGDNQAGNAQRQRRGGFGQEQSAAEKELQDAVEGNAPAETVKAKLANYRNDRKQKQAALDKAQDSLREVLNVRQEAVAVLAGLLN